MKKYLLLLLLCGCQPERKIEIVKDLTTNNKPSCLKVCDNYNYAYDLYIVNYSNHNFAVLCGSRGAALVELKELMPERQNILYVITNR